MLLMDDGDVLLVDNIFLRFMNYRNVFLVNDLFMDHWLQMFMKNILVMLMNHILMLFRYNVLMVLYHNILTLLSNQWLLHMFSYFGTLLMC